MLVLCIDDMMVLTSWEALLKQNGHDSAETLNQVKIKASLPTSHSTKKEKFSQNGDGGHCQLAYNQDCKMKKGAHTDFYKFKKRSHARGHIFSYLNPASCVLHVAKFKFGQSWNRIFKGFSVCLSLADHVPLYDCAGELCQGKDLNVLPRGASAGR